MIGTTTLLGILVVLLGWPRITGWLLRASSEPDELHWASTDDGWRIGVHRYRPLDRRFAEPVLLVHGLGADAGIFDLGTGRSLARYLAEAGFDCWAVDLRGRGASRPLRDGAASRTWTFDDYYQRDLPAAASVVLEHSRASRLHWVGHSMGGVLLWCFLQAHGEQRVASGTVLASALDYTRGDSSFAGLTGTLSWLRPLRVLRFRWIAALLAPLGGRIPNPVDGVMVAPGATDPSVLRRVYRNQTTDVPVAVLEQLATALSAEGLCSRDGALRFRDGAPGLGTPLLSIAGNADRQCPPEAVHGTHESVGTTDKHYVCLGRPHGQRTDYGHLDLLTGRFASVEAYPRVGDWLRRHATLADDHPV